MSPLEDRSPDLMPAAPDRGRRVIRAAAALDADGLIAPAVVVLDDGRVTAVGRPSEIGSVGSRAVEDRTGEVVLPALVNAHVHLDLWSVGTVAIEQGFDGWLAEVRSRRPADEDSIRASVLGAMNASIAGGVGAVGDIAGAMGIVAASVFDDGPLAGTSFVEVFGIGRRRQVGLDAVASVAAFADARGSNGRIGLSPHAPYSCEPRIFAAAAATGLPLATHLAETPEESAFTRFGTGPFVDLLRRVGSLAPEDAPPCLGCHPVEMLAGIEPRRPWLAAHVNYPVEPDEPAALVEQRASMLRERDITVVWCPRAARFLGHPRPNREPHPWWTLRAHGVRVALGTDGRPCLDRADRLSTLDDVRMIMAEGVSPEVAIEMATVDGAVALGLNPDAVRFRGGAGAGLLAVPIDPAGARPGLMNVDAGPEWLVPLHAAAFGRPLRPGGGS
jgi:cytosine/adenosine deaminase-related metal-dependent hydrolase